MSEFAKVPELEKPLSAWKYRDLFLHEGKVFSEFFCPFCGVRLIQKVIYKKDKAVRPPHFALPPGTKHIGNCDGTSGNYTRQRSNTKEEKYNPEEMNYPRAITKRSPPRSPQELAEKDNILPASSKRTKVRSFQSLRSTTPSTYSIDAVVECFEAIENQYKEENLGVKITDWPAINNCRKNMPLQIDDKTNYYYGFRSPSLLDRKYRRIYHNIGDLLIYDDFLLIRSECDATFYDEMKQKKQTRFVINIADMLINKDSRKDHIAKYNQLVEFAKTQCRIKWYALGLPQYMNGKFVLSVGSLDDIYVYSK